METKACNQCQETKPLDAFGVRTSTRDGLNGKCKKCVNKNQLERHHRTRDNQLIGLKAKRIRRKLRVLAHYGGCCACCGETDHRFLTFDHVNGGGRRHLAEFKIGGHLMEWLDRNNRPEGFQVLCFNCNSGRSVNGGVCPHNDPLDRNATHVI